MFLPLSRHVSNNTQKVIRQESFIQLLAQMVTVDSYEALSALCFKLAFELPPLSPRDICNVRYVMSNARLTVLYSNASMGVIRVQCESM